MIIFALITALSFVFTILYLLNEVGSMIIALLLHALWAAGTLMLVHRTRLASVECS